MPIHVLRPGAPAADLPEFVTQLLTSLDGHDSPIDMTKNSSTFGIEPTRLADFVRAFASTATTRSHADADKKAGRPRRLVRLSGRNDASQAGRSGDVIEDRTMTKRCPRGNEPLPSL